MIRTLFMVLCVGLVCSCSREARTEFDGVRWRDADVGTRVRAQMVHDLLKRHPLIGLTRAEVVALLGPPTAREGGWQLIYVLGPDEASMPIDNDWLLIRLDEHNVVAKYAVRPD